MTSTAAGSMRTPPGPRRRLLRPSGRCAVLAIVAACGSSTAPADDPIVPPPPPTTLVGTWLGTIDGSYGPGAFTLELRADSTMGASSTNASYCPFVRAAWTVAARRFTGTGRDCSATLITLTAPVGERRLSGTWTASSGSSGTFSVARR